jgi:hypothetical protein
MPDPNKFKKLREIGYEIPITCGLCTYSRWNRISGPVTWGTCRLHEYQHAKHTGPPRGVSIVSSGTCPDAESGSAVLVLESHAEFLRNSRAWRLAQRKNNQMLRSIV